MGSAFLKGETGAGDEIGHRPRHEHFAGRCVFADGACAFVGTARDPSFRRLIALSCVEAEVS
jgi:hypothetical protein